MEIEKILGVEQIVYQGEDSEQKIYVLPDEEALEQVLAKLREGGLSDTIQLSLSQGRAGQESEHHDTVLDDIAARLQTITNSPTTNPLAHTMSKVEELLGDYLAVDGEQKVYVLPNDLNIEQILDSVAGIRTGEITQSQMWRKTDVTIDNKEQSKILEEITTCVQTMDKRLRRLEYLLNQVADQDK
ncbi:hypothetical protein [Pelosinus sp. sgz500959]|uniref:hypothetical protein n=1 Tax=Pelosinus sp. sgz500959 TaxID=3242472 RepID=UPI00366F247C